MDTMKICRQCQKPIDPLAPEGLCPECLAKVALGTEPAMEPTRTPPSAAELSAQFPQLEIIELLGMGGMGMVYKARQPKLDRIVALKILPVQSSRDPAFAERFFREARALAKLNHPGIVTIYDFGQTDRYYYFVMEFVDGMNLRQVLRAQKLSPEEALQLVTQICAALQFAHEEGIVHRDIKPENILLNKKGVAKIADFGLAKLLGPAPDANLTASQMVMGTLNYMAPEQREKPLTVDHRADIYSLGVVFYEMLTGELPIGRFAPPSQKVHVDVRLDEVVLKSLEKEPGRRYQHASEVKTDVESFSSKALPKIEAAEPVPAHAESHDLVMDLGPIVGVLALVGFGMAVIQAAWPVVFLFITGFLGYRIRNLRTRSWARFIWTIGVMILCAYGVWLARSIWPVICLLVLFDWGAGKSKEDVQKTPARKTPGPVPPVIPVQPQASPAGFPKPEAAKPAAAPPPLPTGGPAADRSAPAASKPAGSFWKPAGIPLVTFGIVLIAVCLFQQLILGPPKTSHFHEVLLRIAVPLAFVIGLRWVMTRRRDGLAFDDLPPQFRRRLTWQIAGISAVAVLGSLALFTVIPIRMTDSREYWFVPRDGSYDKLGMAGEFTCYNLPMGHSYDAVPEHWTLTMTLYPSSNSPVSMDVTLPGLQASYESERVHGALITHVLDHDTLTDWMRDEAKLDVAQPGLQEQSKQIIGLLKSFENLAPHTSQEFAYLAKSDLQAFGFDGFNSNTEFDASYPFLIFFFVLLLVGYFGAAAWIIRRNFDDYRKTLAVA